MMKKYSKYIIVAFVIISILISVCFIPFDANKLIPIIENQVSEEYGIKTHLDKLVLRVGPFIKVKTPIMHIMYEDGENVTIVGNGCHWIQFAPKNKNWWLTCMLNETGEFKHAYFDATDYNIINGTKSWFCDLYLDIVIKNDGKSYILDEDELLEALNKTEINREQYNKAHLVANEIIDL